MKHLISVLLLVATLKSTAQKKEFDMVVINYGRGHNSWVIPGPYANEEQFEFALIKSGRYILTNDFKLIFSLNKDSVEVIDTIKAPFHQYKITAEKVDSLYTSLSTTKPNFTTTFIRPYLKTPSIKRILDISKELDKEYLFEDDDPKDMKGSIYRIRHFDKIDSFINLKRPNPEIYTVTTDVGEGANIRFIRNNDTTVFYCDFLQVLGQPILKRRENRRFVGTQTVNVDINNLLGAMLPASSETRKRVEINGLIDYYIRWYIHDVL